MPSSPTMRYSRAFDTSALAPGGLLRRRSTDASLVEGLQNGQLAITPKVKECELTLQIFANLASADDDLHSKLELLNTIMLNPLPHRRARVANLGTTIPPNVPRAGPLPTSLPPTLPQAEGWAAPPSLRSLSITDSPWEVPSRNTQLPMPLHLQVRIVRLVSTVFRVDCLQGNPLQPMPSTRRISSSSYLECHRSEASS